MEKAQSRLETLEKDFSLLGLWKRPIGFGKSQKGYLASCVYIYILGAKPPRDMRHAIKNLSARAASGNNFFDLFLEVPFDLLF